MISIPRLRELGLKLTPQRLAILEVLEGNTEHPSAEDIYKQLKSRYPSLSLTTVYNTLEVLAGAGELQEIRIRANKRHFDPNPAPHGHFLCRICGAIDDVETGPLEIQAPLQTKGYFVEKYAPYFYGICPRCRERDRGSNQ